MLDLDETSKQDTLDHEETHEVMTVDEVAALLRLNRKTVYASFKKGEIPGGRRIGGAIRFSRSAVLQWLADGQGCASRSLRGVR
jgi:excisionase family DNA binding protein